MTAEGEGLALAPEDGKRPEIYMPDPPPSLTRFYGDLGYAQDVFQSQCIALVHNSMMNDPFDPHFEFVTNFEANYAVLKTWVKANHGGHQAFLFGKQMPYEHWVRAVKDIKGRNAAMKATTFLFCASAPYEGKEPFENLYMWGHYCAGHRGIAIEFDSAKLAEAVAARQKMLYPDWDGDLKVWTPVLYREVQKLTPADIYEFVQTPPGHDLDTEFSRQLNTVSRSKSPVWEPENEWRLMWRSDQTAPIVYRLKIPPGSIRRVFIGVRVSAEKAKLLAAECQAAFPEAQIYRGAHRPNEFALDFTLIE